MPHQIFPFNLYLHNNGPLARGAKNLSVRPSLPRWNSGFGEISGITPIGIFHCRSFMIFTVVREGLGWVLGFVFALQLPSPVMCANCECWKWVEPEGCLAWMSRLCPWSSVRRKKNPKPTHKKTHQAKGCTVKRVCIFWVPSPQLFFPSQLQISRNLNVEVFMAIMFYRATTRKTCSPWGQSGRGYPESGVQCLSSEFSRTKLNKAQRKLVWSTTLHWAGG